MIRESLKMLSQYAVDNPTFPVNQRYSHLVVILAGMLSRRFQPPDIWDTHGISGYVLVNPPASSSSPYPGGFNRCISNVTQDTSPHVTSERPNARHSFGSKMPVRTVSQNFIRPYEGRFQRIMGQTNNDCRFRIFILTNSLHQQHLLVGR